MQDLIKEITAQTAQTQKAITPRQAVAKLKEGNKRFVTGQVATRNHHHHIKQSANGQYPFAVVLGCIDSRVPSELVFDQGIGDIFNIRIAGNFVNPDILGSMEFSCKVAGSKAVVVMGHVGCGAVQGACDEVKLGYLTEMLSSIQPAIDAVTDIDENRTSNNPGFVQKVADMNVQLAIRNIRAQSDVLREMEENGEIVIVGAMYDINTGRVAFMEAVR